LSLEGGEATGLQIQTPHAPPHPLDFRHPLYSLFTALERSFGRFAFPNAVRILVVFQIAATLLSQFVPGYRQLLLLEKDRIIEHYEVWRLFTFLFVSDFSGNSSLLIVYVLFTLSIMWMINEGLESAWGSFGVTLYLFVTWLGMVVAAWILPVALQRSLAGIETMILDVSLFGAFATLYPKQEIRIWMVLPVEVRWLGLIGALLLARRVIIGVLVLPTPFPGLQALPALLGVIPYLIVFAPGFFHWMVHRGETAARQARFRSKQLPVGEVFHVCAKCGITDQTRPEIEFRVAADGEDYCPDCRPVA